MTKFRFNPLRGGRRMGRWRSLQSILWRVGAIASIGFLTGHTGDWYLGGSLLLIYLVIELRILHAKQTWKRIGVEGEWTGILSSSAMRKHRRAQICNRLGEERLALIKRCHEEQSVLEEAGQAVLDDVKALRCEQQNTHLRVANLTRSSTPSVKEGEQSQAPSASLNVSRQAAAYEEARSASECAHHEFHSEVVTSMVGASPAEYRDSIRRIHNAHDAFIAAMLSRHELLDHDTRELRRRLGVLENQVGLINKGGQHV